MAYAVADLHNAIEKWASKGAGPFFVREHIDVRDVTASGIAASFDHSSAYGQWGELMLELLVIHDAPTNVLMPSTLFPSTAGLHHVAHIVSSFSEAGELLSASGFPEVLRAHTASGRPFAFHDARHELGHLIEIYEDSPSLRAFYEQVRVAAIAQYER